MIQVINAHSCQQKIRWYLWCLHAPGLITAPLREDDTADLCQLPGWLHMCQGLISLISVNPDSLSFSVCSNQFCKLCFISCSFQLCLRLNDLNDGDWGEDVAPTKLDGCLFVFEGSTTMCSWLLLWWSWHEEAMLSSFNGCQLSKEGVV